MRHNLFVYYLLFVSFLSTCVTNDVEQPEFLKQIKLCNYIGHDISFKTNEKYTFQITQKEKIFEFKNNNDERPVPGRDESEYYLNIGEADITTGSAYFTWGDGVSITNKIEITFTDYFFNPDLEKTIDYGILNITKLQCEGARDYIRIKKTNDWINWDETSIESKDCGFDFSQADPGIYGVFAENPYTGVSTFVNSFTHISHKERYKNKISMDLPIQTMPFELNTFFVTYPKDYNTMLKMKIRPETSIELELTNDTNLYGYFELYDSSGDNFEYKVFLNCSKEVIYHVSQIIFSDYHYVNFNEDEYQIGHFFFINEPYYALNDSPTVILSFYSKEQAQNHQGSIKYKSLTSEDTQHSTPTCNIEGHKLLCNVDGPKETSYVFGIGNSLVSSKMVTVFSYSSTFEEVFNSNMCLVLPSDTDKRFDEFNVELSIPNQYLPEDFDIQVNQPENGLSCSKTNPTDKNMGKYSFTCYVDEPQEGNYDFTVLLDSKYNITLKELIFEIKDYERISAIFPDSLYIISESQEFTLEFRENIPSGVITSLQFRSDDFYSDIFTLSKDSTNKKKVFTITNLDSDKSKLDIGQYEVYINSPCSDGNMIPTGQKITLKSNPIVSVSPDYVVITDSKLSSTIKFKYTISKQQHQLKFGNSVEIDLNDKSTDSITINGNNFIEQKIYDIFISDHFEKFKNTNYQLHVFKEKIQLQSAKSYVYVGTQLEKLIIPLKNTILEKQILNITSDQIKIKERKLVNGKEIELILNKYFTQYEVGSYSFKIFDKAYPNEALIYTLICENTVNLAVANITIGIDNPAVNGNNPVVFTFEGYDTSKIKSIIYTKVNRQTGEESPFECCYGDKCDCSIVKNQQITDPSIQEISTNIKFTSEEKYLYKYVLKSINDDVYERTFKNDEYMLLDFSVSQNIFGFLDSISSIVTKFQLYNDLSNNNISETIMCEIETEDGLEGECENNKQCGNSCEAKCTPMDDGEMNCEFQFLEISKEATILYRFSTDDKHPKPLHIMRLVPPPSLCRPVTFTEDVEFQVCLHRQVNDLVLYLNGEDEDLSKNCVGFPLTTQANTCTSIYISQDYLELDSFKMKVVRNQNDLNTFTLETYPPKITFFNEVMRTIQGHLTAQFVHDQKISYIFPPESDTSLITEITLTKKLEDGNQRILEATLCKVKDNNKHILECSYNLEDKIDYEDLGLYYVSYTHSTCGKEVFTTEISIEVEAPPIILSSLSQRYAWLGEETAFTLTYTYLFYGELQTIPSKLVLVNVDSSEKKIVELKYNSNSRNTLTFKSEIKFVSPGVYYIIEKFSNGNEEITHQDKRIIFYYNPIKIEPTNVTYYTDETPPESVTTQFTAPIIKEQISSVTLGSKNVIYDFTPNNITFKFTPGLIDFTKGKTHDITIKSVTGDEIVFTVEVIYVVRLPNAVIKITGPEPGYENQTNYVAFYSENYNLTKLTRIKFLTLNEQGEEVDFIVDKNTILENYSASINTIILPLYLNHNNYYKHPEVYNDDLNESQANFDYILIGFFIERHFYIYDKTEANNNLFYHINCYTVQNAKKTLAKLQLNGSTSGECYIHEKNRNMIQCPYTYGNNYTPQTLEILVKSDIVTQSNDITRNLNEEIPVLKIYLINAETDKTCFTTLKQDQKSTLTLTTSENIGPVRCQLKDETTLEHMPISETQVNGLFTWKYQLELNIPEVYDTKILQPGVYFQRNGEEFFFEVPDMQFEIINYAQFVNITQKFINPSSNSQIFLTLTFSHELSKSDISHVMLMQTNGEEQYMLNNCSVYAHAKFKKVFTCDLSEITKEHDLSDTFKVVPYDKCGNVFEYQGGEVEVVFSDNYNNLYQISPKSTTLNEIEYTSFSLIYRTTLKKGPKEIVLLRYDDESETDYRITFESKMIFPENKELNISLPKLEKEELGLFKIKSIFDDNGEIRTDISDVSILIYKNNIQLEKEDELKPLGTEMENVVIRLKEEIIPEQISMISYIVKNKKEDEIETTWTLNNGKEIIVSFGKTITIDDNYVIKVYNAKDETKTIYTIKAEVLIDFEFSREFIDLENDTYVEVTIKPIENDGKLIERFETTHSDAQIDTINENELIYGNGGLADVKSQRSFKLKFTKSEYFKPVVELTFKYYYTDIKEPFNIKQTVKITDSSYPFFNYGGVDKDIYKGDPLKIHLLDNQHFTKMYYEGLQAYLKINGKKEHLEHDLEEPRMFYLNETKKFAGSNGELIIYEKNNEKAIVDQGFIIYFDIKDKPDISNDPCNNGSLVDGFCKCLKGLFGVNCTFTKSNVDDAASEYAKEIENGVDIKNPTIRHKLIDFTAIAKEVEVKLPDLSGQLEIFENSTPQDEAQAQGYFAWASLIIAGSKNGKRNLAESVSQKVLKRTKQTAQNFKIPFDKEYMKMVMPLQNIYYHKIRSSKEAFEHYIESNKLAQISYVEVKEITKESNEYYLLSANEENESNKIDTPVVSLNFEMISGDGRLLQEMKEDSNVLLHYSQSDPSYKVVKINEDLFEEYKLKGINIYNIEDPAFSNKCYSTNPEKFDYDLTQEYRKTNIFQNVSFALDNANCKYLGLDKNPGYITYECPQENKVSANLELQVKLLNDKVINHLALKCIGELSGLGKNIALWVFLIILLLTSAVIVLIKLDFIKEPQIVIPFSAGQHHVVCTTVGDEMNERKVSDIPIYIQKSFFDIFKYNIKNYYPIVALFFRENRLNNVVIFVFSLFTLFGFNAIYFTENHIEDRITSNSRSKFNYPVNNEADVIFASIFTSLLVLAVVRLLALLMEKLKEKDLQNQKLHMVLELAFGIFCLAFSLFFWVYCIGFCGMYKNTQSGWIFACIWSLIFNWIMFGPVYMIVVSIVEWKLNMDPEFKEENKVMYYIKELFEF